MTHTRPKGGPCPWPLVWSHPNDAIGFCKRRAETNGPGKPSGTQAHRWRASRQECRSYGFIAAEMPLLHFHRGRNAAFLNPLWRVFVFLWSGFLTVFFNRVLHGYAGVSKSERCRECGVGVAGVGLLWRGWGGVYRHTLRCCGAPPYRYQEAAPADEYS